MKTYHYCRFVVLFLLAACAVRTANADPVGGQVVAGQATISSPASGVLNINQSSSRVIINWNSFSIASGEVTSFIQPSANAAALNRVMSDNPSLIYGSLQANGHVYLINQSGILVGPGGSVNTGGFTASTLDVSDKSFLLGGNLGFSGGSTAGVNNQGSIRALGGDVFLIANTVANSGSISAPKGTVGLAAGSRVQLLMSGQDRISVLAGNSSTPQAGVGVNNLGSVESAAAELKAAGGNIYALAINNGGVVRATSLVNENGSIMLKSDGGNIANSGTLSANNADGSGGSVTLDGGHNAANPSTVVDTGIITARGDAPGATGGAVKILGDHVGLFDHALVDVSGDAGGGTALIGGSFQGKDASVQNAEMTIVGPDAAIKADALTSGDGGMVVVWSDESTRFYGLIDARGGSRSGNGGSAEVSGRDSLEFSGSVDLTAANGHVGELLLDPKNITITNGGSTNSFTGNTNFAQGSSNSVTFTGTDLANLLGTADVTLQANNNIVFDNNVDASGQATIHNLTLQAGNSITLNNSTITLTPTGNTAGSAFNATFNDAGADPLNRDPGTATFTMNGTSAINAAGGVTIQAGTFGASGDITLTSINTSPGAAVGASLLNGGNIAINNAPAGNGIIVSGTLTTDGKDASALPNTDGGRGGDIQLTAGGLVTLNGALSANGAFGRGSARTGGNGGNISLTSGMAMSLAGIHATGGPVNGGAVAGADGAVTLANTGQLTGTGLITAGTLNLNGGGDVGTPVTSLSTAVATLALNKTGGNSFVSDSGAQGTLTVQGSTAGDLTLSDPTAAITFGASTVSGNLSVTAGGAITQTGNLIANGVGKTATFSAAGHDIVLNTAAANDFTTASFTGANVSVSDANNINLGASTVTGNLAVNANGNINGTGALIVSGGGKTAAFTTSGANADILLGAANNFSSVSVGTSGGGSIHSLTLRNISGTAALPALPATILGDLILTFNNAGINLPGITVSGNAIVTAGGNITEGGNLVMNGGGKTATFIATGHDIILNTAPANDFTSANFTGANVSVSDANAIILGASTITGNLSVTAGGTITESGNLVANGVGKTATFSAAGNDIVLNTAPANDFATASFTGANVSVSDVNAIILGASTVTGNLSVTAGGNISESGNLVVNGVGKTATFSAAGHDITLNTAPANDFTSANFTGANVSVSDVNGIDLGASTITGNLSVTAGGDITESGNLVANGPGKTATFSAAGHNIVLNTAPANDFTTASFTGADVSVSDVNDINLGASTVTGNLTVNAGGNIDGIGALIVSGVGKTAAFTTAGANKDILLGAANNFSSVTVGTTGGGSIHSLTLRNISGTATLPALPAAISGDLSLAFDNTGINLPGITVAGNASVTAGGNITESGNLVVNGSGKTAAFSAAGHDIVLNTAPANDFTSASFTGANVSVSDVNGIDLGASTVTGNLSVTAGGNITESGNLVANGPGKTATFSAAGHDITLNTAPANDFTSASFTGANVSVSDINGIDLGASTITGNLSVTAGGNITESANLVVNGVGNTATFSAAGHDIVLNTAAANDFATASFTGANVSVSDANAIILGASTITGNLSVTAGGTITESGNLVVNGVGKTATFSAAGNDIVLNTAANDFTSASFTGANVSVSDVNGIDLGASTVTGNLNVTAGGNITESGNLVVNGVGSTATFSAAGHDITLDTAPANDFTSANFTGANVSVSDVNGIDLGASTVTGDLNVTAGGNITESGNLVANGAGKTATFSAAGHDIVLNTAAANDFTTAGFTGANVSVSDVNGIDLGASTVSGNLAVTAGGAITENGGPLVMTGGAGTTATFVAGANDITLNNGANDFTSASFTGANVSVSDVNGIDLGASTATGNLSVTAGGDITESGNLVVNGVGSTATFSAAGHDITLNTAPANDFTTASFTGANVSVSDVNGIDLGASTVSGNLAVIAGGPITETGGPLVMTGGAGTTATFVAGANDITLNNGANDFTTAGFTGANVSVSDVNGIDLGASTVSGNLAVTAGGAITENGGPLVMTGGAGTTATFVAGANDITLNNGANDFTSASFTGANVSVSDVNGIDLGASTATGNLTVTAGGDITESGNLVVNGVGSTATFSAAGHDITLNTAPANDFTTASFTGANASVSDVNAIDLGASTVTGNLSVNAGGGVTQSGAVQAGGLGITAAGPVVLDGANHVANLAGSVSGSGNAFSFTDLDPLTVTTVNGVNGISTVDGAVTLTADNLSINQAVNSGTARTTLQPFTAGEGIDLGTKTAGELGLTAAEVSLVTAAVLQVGNVTAGDITISGPISIDPGGLSPNPGATSITAPRLNLVTAGNITETSGSLTVPVLSIQAGGNVSLTSPINNVNYLGSQSGTPIHFVDIDTLLPAPIVLDGQTLPGVNPQPADVRGGGGGINVSTLSVQLAGIAYVDIPILKLSGANFTARVEGNPATILPPGSIATLGLTVPFPEAEDQQAPRRIEDRTKWVTGRMVVSGSTAAPQSSK